MSPIRNQLSCSCCWAIAAAAAVECAYQIHMKEFVHLSIQELIDCNEPSPKHKDDNDDEEEDKEDTTYDSAGCYNFSINQAFRYIMKNGISLEVDYPFKAKRGLPQTLDGVSKKFVRSFCLIPNEDEEALMEEVNKQPVAAAMKVFDGLTTLKDEIYMGPKVPEEELGTHCVLIVGYGTEMLKRRKRSGKMKNREKPMNYWLVKNGWGEDWGVGGYAKVCMKSSLPPGSESLFYRCSFPII